MEGAVEGAFGAGFVAAEVVEIVGADDEDPSEIAVGDVAAFADVGAVIVETVVPDAGFGAVEAAEAPGGEDDGLGEDLLAGAGGLEIAEEGVAEGVVLGLVLCGEDGALGGEAVAEGVEAGDGLAFGGTRTGGLLGIGAVGGQSSEARRVLVLGLGRFALGVRCWVLGVGHNWLPPPG